MENAVERHRAARCRTEERGMYCSARELPNGQLVLSVGGQSFASLPDWNFGLITRPGVSVEQARAIAAQINELCDGAYASVSGRDCGPAPIYAGGYVESALIE